MDLCKNSSNNLDTLRWRKKGKVHNVTPLIEIPRNWDVGVQDPLHPYLKRNCSRDFFAGPIGGFFAKIFFSPAATLMTSKYQEILEKFFSQKRNQFNVFTWKFIFLFVWFLPLFSTLQRCGGCSRQFWNCWDEKIKDEKVTTTLTFRSLFI